MDDSSATSNYDLHDCTPNREQNWLLHAAISGGDQAVEAWQSWRDHIDLDTVDPASFRLLPLAYRNMINQGHDDALLKRLKGVYRHSWYKNQIQYRQAQKVLASFNKAGIPTMLLKGAALSERFYLDDGIRFMNDVDLMVPETDYEQAATMMLERGWQPALQSRDSMFWYHRHRFKHACAFKQGNIELDLHCQLLRFMPQNNQAFWRSSIEGTWRGYPVRYLNDTDQLFHTCVHGVRWSYAYLSWIPDALTILRSKTLNIVWESLLETAQTTRTILYLRNALAYLKEEFQAPIPYEVMRKLGELPVSWVERQEYLTMGQKQTSNIGYQARRVLYQSCRYRSTTVAEQQPIKLSLTAWIRFLIIHLHPPGWWPPA